MNDEIRDWLASGDAFKVGQPLDEDQDRAAWREAVRTGLARYVRNGLLPDFRPQFLVAQVAGSTYDAHGRPRASTAVPGDLRVLRNTQWLRVIDSGATVSPFSAATLILPGRPGVELRPTQAGGVLELVLTSERPIRAHAWTPERRGMDILLYCAAATAAELDDFRLLGLAPWTVHGRPVGPRVGVPPPVAAPALWRSPAGKQLARAQPVFAGRFLRIPAEPWADHDGAEVCFRVPLGDAGRVLTALADRLMLHCVPVWNAAVAAVEPDRAAGAKTSLELDPAPLQDCRSLLVLDCFDRAGGRSWRDERFAGHRDPVTTFRQEARPPGAVLHFRQSLGGIPLRVVYLAGLGPLRDVRADETWLAHDAERLLVRCEPAAGAELAASWADDCLEGRAVTEREVVELLWRLMPAPVRRQLDWSALERFGAAAVTVRQELRRDPAPCGPVSQRDLRATPVTRVTFPGQAGAEDLAPWLFAWARGAQEFCSFGERLEVDLRAFASPSPRA